MISIEHREARKIMEKYLGRKLSMYELIHHIDENPQNNNITNLQILTPEEHGSIHGGKKQHRTLPAWNKTEPFIIKQILEFHKRGYNYSQISKLLRISDQTVRRYAVFPMEL